MVLSGAFTLPFLIATVYFFLNSAKLHPIIISGNGIQIDTYNILVWKFIDYAYVYHKKKQTYFRIEYTQNGEKEVEDIDIVKYAYTKEDIHNAVNFWSGRLIGAQWNKYRDELIAERGLTDDAKVEFMKECERYVPLFYKERDTMLWVFVCLFVAIVTCVGFLGGANSHSLSYYKGLSLLVFGFSLCLVVLLVIGPYMTDRFRKNSLLGPLSEETFKEIYKIAHDGDEYVNEEKDVRIYAIISIVMAVVSFFCYLLLP
ncbi:MAG: hypothetical protein J6T28_02625 [Paludibacteraceae bacterium]|nr:hypothetical protein [Paludibacteraceae bacterium]